MAYWNAAGLAATRAVEGGSAGYTAHDPNSSASGAYSFLTGTWQTYQAKYNQTYGTNYNYPIAAQAPPAVQDQVASITPVSNWGGTWAGSHGANAANPAYTQATPLAPDQISSTGGTADPNALVNPNDPTATTVIPGQSGNPITQGSQALSQIGQFTGNWIVRGGIVVLGIVLIGAAAFHLAQEHAPASVKTALK